MAQIKSTYIDRPEIAEIFVDSLGLSIFDGQTYRLEFCITRMDEPKPPQAPTGRKYPAARIVLTGQAVVDLFNNLQNVIGVMEKQGQIKREGGKAQTIQ